MCVCKEQWRETGENNEGREIEADRERYIYIYTYMCDRVRVESGE